MKMEIIINDLIKNLSLIRIKNRYIFNLKLSFRYILRSNSKCKINVFAKLVHIYKIVFKSQPIIFFILKMQLQINFELKLEIIIVKHLYT